MMRNLKKFHLSNIPASFSHVSDGVGAGPSVHDEQLMSLRVRVHYKLNIPLVLPAPLPTHLLYINKF